MADQDLSIVTPSIAQSTSIATIGKSWGAVGPTGAASFELPLPLSAGRGFDPQLTLTYSSQAGNGPFGIGWSLGGLQIARRTHKGTPRYTDHDEIVGHDGEVWMAERDEQGRILSRNESRYAGLEVGPHSVVRFWPRIESDFSLRERWQPEDGRPPFWLIHGADGSLQVYGKTAAARRADADDPARVSAWLLCESMNPLGEHICITWKADDQDPDPVHDYRAQRYVDQVLYGNVTASKDLYHWRTDDPATLDWHFRLLFDYGERTLDLTQRPAYAGPSLTAWPVRPDPFSTFAQGFELGTRRLCRQVLMFHHFPEETGNEPVLVRRLLLEYTQDAPGWAYSQISAAHYQAWDASGAVEHTPPVEFEHSPFTLDKTPRPLLMQGPQPGIEDGRSYQCVDLYGEGVPGFLCRYDQAWHYREPLREEAQTIGYGPWTLLDKTPVANARSPARQWLTDLTGDGRPDWITARPGMSGWRTLNADRTFAPFIPFNAFPTEFFRTLAQLGDLSGDGLASVALIGPRSVRLYANRREHGFAPGEDVAHLPDDDRLPLFGPSPYELVMLGNLLGSDMPELCRIRHNEIKCWPNLGHGRFGKGRVISALPFAREAFDVAHIRIADLDGSGAPALIYLKSDAFEIYLNRGGRGLEQTPVTVPWPEGVRYDNVCQVTLADLQGLGCASLILTVPHMTPRHWRYDFVSAKPYLLTASQNNMGCSTRVTYRSSAQEWLDEKRDRLGAHPTVAPACHLPFPIQVVSHQQQLDEVTGNRLTQAFTYREGFYDGEDREFRGFGHLQQHDSESAGASDDAGFTAPLRLHTWFHTGQSIDRSREGYFDRDPEAVPLGHTVFSRYHPGDEFDEPVTPPDAETEHAIARALAGLPARSETYAAADDPATALPFAVTEHRYRVREVRAKGPHDAYAVLLPLALEQLDHAYEQVIEDPLSRHELTLSHNAYGAPLHALTVHYARRRTESDPPPFTDPDEQQWWRDAHDEAQQSFYVSETRARFIDLDDDLQHWRLGLPYQERGNALVLPKGALPDGLTPQQVSFEQLLRHQDSPAWNTRRTLTRQTVRRYLKTEGQTPLPDGQADFEALAAPLEIAQMDKTALDAYADVPPPFDIRTELAVVGYAPMPLMFEGTPLTDREDNLWSARYGFAAYATGEGFHRVLEYNETLSHGITRATYDPYHLAIVSVELPDGCTTRVEYDYHALQPMRIIDANDNQQEAVYEPSGQPLASSFHGTENGLPAGFRPLSEYVRPTNHRPDPAIDDPAGAVQNAAGTWRKDLFSWMGQLPPASRADAGRFARWVGAGLVLPDGHIRASARRRLARDAELAAQEQALSEAIALTPREPVHSVMLRADRYPGDPVPAQIQIVKTCIDGFGRPLQTQQRVEPGSAYAVDADGSLIIEDGRPVEVQADPRWRISERVEYNNKGLAVRRFRPFFADTHHYVNDASLREHGFFDQLFYDVLGRPVRLVNAKGHFSRETYHPWYHISEDFNDTDESVPQP